MKNKNETNGKIYQSENNEKISLELIVKTKYQEIYNEWSNSEFKHLLDGNYDKIKEIIYKNQVVGISAYNLIKIPSNNINLHILYKVFIMKKYRGKGLIKNELEDDINNLEWQIAIDSPNLKLIKSLVRYGFAFYVGKNRVISQIPLIVTEEDSKLYISNIYDIYLMGIIKTNGKDLFISRPLDADAPLNIFNRECVNEYYKKDLIEFHITFQESVHYLKTGDLKEIINYMDLEIEDLK